MTAEQQQTRKAVTSGFFSSLFSSFATAPQRGPSPLQAAPEPDDTETKEADEQRRLLQVNETSVTLSVFSAEVNVRLDERMKKELLRATKKNPPTSMKYELIYVRIYGCEYNGLFRILLRRLVKTNTMPVRRKMNVVHRAPAVFSKGCGPILMGECISSMKLTLYSHNYSTGSARVFIVGLPSTQWMISEI